MNDPVYKETVKNTSSFNERLVKERKLRLPFIDAQTGVAQSKCPLLLLPARLLFNAPFPLILGDCYIWSNKLDRMPGYYSAQLYSYPARRWRKKRRQYLLNRSNYSSSAKESEQSQNGENVSSSLSHENINSGNATSAATSFIMSAAGSSVAQNGNGSVISNFNANPSLNDTFDDSKDSWLRDYDDGSDLPDAGELDDAESDFDDYEEYSSRKKKSKRKESIKKKRTDYSDAEKPYQCDLCGARYKTRPGLSYHFSHSHHQESGNGSLSTNGISEEEVSYSNPSINNGNNVSNNMGNLSNNNHSVKSPIVQSASQGLAPNSSSISSSNNGSHPAANHLPPSHPSAMMSLANSQPTAAAAPSAPSNSSQSSGNHLQSNINSSSKPLNSTSSDEKEKPKGKSIIST